MDSTLVVPVTSIQQLREGRQTRIQLGPRAAHCSSQENPNLVSLVNSFRIMSKTAVLEDENGL